jgi:hypothetical protein
MQALAARFSRAAHPGVRRFALDLRGNAVCPRPRRSPRARRRSPPRLGAPFQRRPQTSRPIAPAREHEPPFSPRSRSAHASLRPSARSSGPLASSFQRESNPLTGPSRLEPGRARLFGARAKSAGATWRLEGEWSGARSTPSPMAPGNGALRSTEIAGAWHWAAPGDFGSAHGRRFASRRKWSSVVGAESASDGLCRRVCAQPPRCECASSSRPAPGETPGGTHGSGTSSPGGYHARTASTCSIYCGTIPAPQAPDSHASSCALCSLPRRPGGDRRLATGLICRSAGARMPAARAAKDGVERKDSEHGSAWVQPGLLSSQTRISNPSTPHTPVDS